MNNIRCATPGRRIGLRGGERATFPLIEKYFGQGKGSQGVVKEAGNPWKKGGLANRWIVKLSEEIVLEKRERVFGSDKRRLDIK